MSASVWMTVYKERLVCMPSPDRAGKIVASPTLRGEPQQRPSTSRTSTLQDLQASLHRLGKMSDGLNNGRVQHLFWSEDFEVTNGRKLDVDLRPGARNWSQPTKKKQVSTRTSESARRYPCPQRYTAHEATTIKLRQHLVRARTGHNEARVDSGATPTEKSARNQHDHTVTIGENRIDLKLDVADFEVFKTLKAGHVDLVGKCPMSARIASFIFTCSSK